MSKIKAHLNGTTTCKLCGAEVAAGSWRGSTDRRPNRYMRSHLKRCKGATRTDRAYYLEKGNWPPSPKRRKI